MRFSIRSRTSTALLTATVCLIIGVGPASADHAVGPTRKSGFATCPMGSEVVIESNAIGRIQHGWTTEGGPNPLYYTNNMQHAIYWWDVTHTGRRAVTWYVSVKSYNGSHYGIDFAGYFCNP